MKITDILDENQETEVQEKEIQTKVSIENPNNNKINNLLILLLKIVIFFISFFGFLFGIYYSIKLFKSL